MPLIKEIENFLEDTLIPFLRRNTQQMLEHYGSSSEVEIEFLNTPYMEASIETISSAKFHIKISKGWMIRSALILCLSDQYWSTFKGRRKIHIATQESAYDSYIFRESVPPNFLFERSKPLKFLFLDDFDKYDLQEALQNFPKIYRENSSEENNLPLSVGLDLPERLSSAVKQDLLICYSFLCSHEVAHSLERQITWFDKSELSIVSSEALFEGFEDAEYRLKAAEVDADIAAINWTLNAFCNLTKSFNHQIIERIFRVILLFMASYDLGRQSIREYQGLSASKSSHPIADIRAVTCMYGLFEGLNSGQNKISLDDIWAIFDRSMIHAARTLEAFGILNCGYYILANSLISVNQGSQGMISHFSIALIMQEELSKIEDQYRYLRANGLEGKNFWLWRPLGFNDTDEVLKVKCQKEIEDIFITKVRQQQDPKKTLTDFLRNKREEMEKGDQLLFLQHEFPDDIATNTSRYKVDDDISRRALQIIFNMAEVEMKPLGDTTD